MSSLRDLRGLAGQSMAGGLIVPNSLSAFELGGRSRFTTTRISSTPSYLDASSYDPFVTSRSVAVSVASPKRGAVFSHNWKQVGGPPGGVASAPNSPVTNFTHLMSSGTSATFRWRDTVGNQFGQFGATEVQFTLTRDFEPPPEPPPLTAVGSPAFQRIFAGQGVYEVPVSFSMTASGGAGGYTYDWGGGTSRFTASNTDVVRFTVNSGGGIHTPGCFVTDAASTTILVGGIRFEVVEYGH